MFIEPPQKNLGKLRRSEICSGLRVIRGAPTELAIEKVRITINIALLAEFRRNFLTNRLMPTFAGRRKSAAGAKCL